MLLSALVLEISHTLYSNSLLEQLQHSIKAVKFWCGDNAILNNVTLQVFLPIRQLCQCNGDVSSVIENSAKHIDTRLFWV